MGGEVVVSDRVAKRWFQRFNTREENTKDLPLPARPKLWNIENIRTMLEKIRKKVPVGCQKHFVNEKIPYIDRLIHSQRYTEAVILYLMN